MKKYFNKVLRIFGIICITIVFAEITAGAICPFSDLLRQKIEHYNLMSILSCIIVYVFGIYMLYKLSFFNKNDDEKNTKTCNNLQDNIKTYDELVNQVNNCKTQGQIIKTLSEIVSKYYSNNVVLYNTLTDKLNEKESELFANDTDFYMHKENCINRLYNEYKKYGKLIIAVDFDDTIFDFHKLNRKYDRVILLLKDFENYADIVIFSNKEEKDYGILESYLKEIGIKYKGINIDVLPQMKGRKMYANVYLDDRAGLGETVEILEEVLYRIENNI